jgi:hypothetical protein
MRGSSARPTAFAVAAFAVAAIAVAALAAGCGTSPLAGPSRMLRAPAPDGTAVGSQSGIAAGPLGIRVRPGCRDAAVARPAGRTVVVTLAGNGKTYCVRVDDTLRVYLPATGTGRWQQPLVSGGGAVVTAPGAGYTPTGGTRGSFAAVRPGRVIMTSVLSPCQYTVQVWKNVAEPAEPLPTAYAHRECPPDHRFSALILVRR